MNNELRYQNKQFLNSRGNTASLIEQKVRSGSNIFPYINQNSNIISSLQSQQDVKLRAKEEKWDRIKEDVRKQYSDNQNNKSGQENLIIYLVFFLFFLTTLYFAPYQFYEPKAPNSNQ